jgi:hypothetical protein
LPEALPTLPVHQAIKITLKTAIETATAYNECKVKHESLKQWIESD